MHFLETYALNSGLKIDKPYIFQKYYPILYENFIVFSHDNYEHYQDVIDIIKPHLKDIDILYLKKEKDEEFDDCKEITNLDYNQIAHLISKSKLYLGEPTFYSDLASHYDIPTVTLYAKAYPQNVRPYWSKENDHEIVVNHSGDRRPHFNSPESYEDVNTLKPEKIAKAILSALKIDFNYDYDTVYMGKFYQSNDIIVEIIPDKNPPVLMHHANCAVRMDLRFDERYLSDILKLRPMQVWTNNPIDEKILQKYSSRIQQIFYIISGNDHPDFVNTLKKLSINTTLVSFLDEKTLNSKKLSYVDYDPIVNLRAEEPEEFKNLQINSLFYSSCKAIYEGGLYYPSEYARNNMMAIKDPFSICKFNKSDILLKDLPYFKVLAKHG